MESFPILQHEPVDEKGQPMSMAEIGVILAQVRPARRSGKKETEDGTRVHVHYGAFRPPTAQAIQDA